MHYQKDRMGFFQQGKRPWLSAFATALLLHTLLLVWIATLPQKNLADPKITSSLWKVDINPDQNQQKNDVLNLEILKIPQKNQRKNDDKIAIELQEIQNKRKDEMTELKAQEQKLKTSKPKVEKNDFLGTTKGDTSQVEASVEDTRTDTTNETAQNTVQNTAQNTAQSPTQNDENASDAGGAAGKLPTTTPNPVGPRRLPESTAMDSVLGLGGVGGMGSKKSAAGEGLGKLPSLGDLRGGLDMPQYDAKSDGERVAENVENMMRVDIADDQNRLGLNDDYFRILGEKIKIAWQPARRDLNDGGKMVTHEGFFKSLFTNPEVLSGLGEAYQDMAKQYAQGNQPRLDDARREQLRELLRSRQSAFRVTAVAEIAITQGADGRMMSVEVFTPSGHPRLDDGMRDAIVRALQVMNDEPPERVGKGRNFTSRWRLRATWSMVPPTAPLTGMEFAITKDGIEADVPFQIKLKTNVSLLRKDPQRAAAKKRTKNLQ